ncbi:hypothetical protein J6590_043066 [Homalodisca vitripennis]|nr:hypothetical protein J6590_043066 [Homalodisca vitripennis]
MTINAIMNLQTVDGSGLEPGTLGSRPALSGDLRRISANSTGAGPLHCEVQSVPGSMCSLFLSCTVLVTTIIVSPQAVHLQGAVRVPSQYTRSTAYFFSPDSKYSQSYSGSYNYNVQTRPNYDRSHIVPVRASNPIKAAEPVQSQNYGKSNNPVLDFLSPSGLRITFPG